MLDMSEENGITMVKFRRSLILCNDEDRNVEKGLPYVIFSWNNQDPSNGDISYHGPQTRGSKQINFFDTGEKKKVVLEDDIEVLSFTVSNVILPSSDTFYYCQTFKIPQISDGTKHIVKVIIIFYNLLVE
jgi:hypothetical protein